MRKPYSVTVVWHSRPKNLDLWLFIMPKISGAELIQFNIIHNGDGENPEIRSKVESAGARYIPRKNVGMDIGAFQDVCRRRLAGFDYDYDYLLWFTDDCFPMKPDFVDRFVSQFTQGTGMVCMEVSTQIRRHTRTTGFCLPREAVEKMVFQVDPVTTKQHCYQFEHRGPDTLYEQILKAGKAVRQVADLRRSPVWDSGGGGHGWVNRRQEFERTWEVGFAGSKVVVVAPAYLRYPVIVPSMFAQTYHNWELHLVHDGPAPNDFPRFDDSRIIFTEGKNPRKNFGHPIREDYLRRIRDKKIFCDYVVITNDDNYHAPFFLEKLVKALDENPGSPGAYCSAMVHNYAGVAGDKTVKIVDGHAVNGYGVINVRPQRGFIDCCAVMLRASFAGQSGWPDNSHSSDWNFLDRAAKLGGGWDKFRIVPGALVTHN